MNRLLVIGDTIELDGYKVGTLFNDVPATVRARVEASLDGRHIENFRPIAGYVPQGPKRRKGKRK